MIASHNGETICNKIAFKMKVILHAEQFSKSTVACRYNVDRRMVARWVNSCTQTQAQITQKRRRKEKKRLTGGGRI